MNYQSRIQDSAPRQYHSELVDDDEMDDDLTHCLNTGLHIGLTFIGGGPKL